MDENSFEFKDKEIEKITAELAKADKRRFGESLKNPPVGAQDSRDVQDSDKAQEKDLTAMATTAAASTPVENNGKETAKKDLYSIVKPLRTYERDIAETIRSNNESVASINLDAQKRQGEESYSADRTERATKKGLTFLTSLVLIVAGTGIISFIYYFLTTRPPAITPVVPSIIATNEIRTIDITGLDYQSAVDSIRGVIKKPGVRGDLVQLEIKEGVAENKKNISPGRFFELFATNASPALGRAFGNQWVFGFVTANAGASDDANAGTDVGTTTDIVAPFIFLSVDSFNNAFDGMIKWEKKIREDLLPFFVGLETLVPTPGFPTPESDNNFEDAVIRSKDVRILRDNSGNSVLMYSFLDQKNLVIAADEQTFLDVINRFFTSRIVR